MAKSLGDKGLPVNILIDYSEAGNIDQLTVNWAKILLKSLEFHKAAGFSSSESNTKIVEEVVRAANIEDRVHLFEARAEAEAWISE